MPGMTVSLVLFLGIADAECCRLQDMIPLTGDANQAVGVKG